MDFVKTYKSPALSEEESERCEGRLTYEVCKKSLESEMKNLPARMVLS